MNDWAVLIGVSLLAGTVGALIGRVVIEVIRYIKR